MSAREVLERYGALINTHDFSRLAPLIAPDCQFWFSSGTHRGLDAARRAFETTWSRIEDEVYSITDVEWICEGDRAAACTYTFRWRGVIDGAPREGAGRGTTCLRLEADGWKVVHEHLSPFPA